MKQEKISAWTMRGLVKVIQTSGLSTISNALDESIDEEGVEEEITTELEAKAAAFRIFQNVTRPGSKYEITFPMSLTVFHMFASSYCFHGVMV